MDTENVMVYTLSTCSHCKSAKKFLADNGVGYDSLDVDLLQGEERAAAIEKVKQYNPKCSFPTLVIGDTIIVGFREQEIREALGL